MQLEQILGAPTLDPVTAAELAGADRVQYVIEQRFRYEYTAPVRDLRHRLVVVPPIRHGEQLRRSHRLTIDGAVGRRRSAVDRLGNPVVRFTAASVERHLDMALVALVERVTGAGPNVAPEATLRDPRWRCPSRLTRPDVALHTVGQAAVCGVADPRERAIALCHAAYRALSYGYGFTAVDTTAAEAITIGRGVCQDYAHVMLALCHAVGLPARYVSGHLIGQGGTHAWVEMLVPHPAGAEVLALDPCNDRPTDRRYLTVATGPDYRSVAPTSGSFSGEVSGRLTASRRVGVLRAA
jgi:transglutaminase-like putative cysteine protease